MTASSSPGGRCRHLLPVSPAGHGHLVLRALKDADKWPYVINLTGPPDLGPYVKDEIVSAFDVEAESCVSRAPASDSSDVDGTGIRLFPPMADRIFGSDVLDIGLGAELADALWCLHGAELRAQALTIGSRAT